MPVRLPARRLLELAAAPSALEALSPLAGVDAVVVELDDDPSAGPAVAARLTSIACPLIGLVPAARGRGSAEGPWVDPVVPGRVGRLSHVLELTVADVSSLERVLDGCAEAPLAAATLAHLLRMRRGMSSSASALLTAESLAYATLQGGPEHRRWLERRLRRVAAPAPAATVEVARDGPLLYVTLARPERRNAFDRAMRDGLAEALGIAVHDPTVASVVLRGHGPCFSSGGDLDEFGSAPDPTTAHLVRATRHVPRLLVHLGARVTAHVHGTCLGAGVELPAFAGRVLAARGTTFALPELAMGLVPGAGGTVSLPTRIGADRTAYLVLSGSAIDAEAAHRWGLVDELVEPEQLSGSSPDRS